ncbi:MAG: hypothetical protein AAFV95_20985 [Bacteroidota bacterium]
MADKSLDFNKLKKRKPASPAPEKPKKVYKEVEVVPATEKAPVAKVSSTPTRKKGKVGRRSWKQQDVEYMRVSFDTPVATYQKIKQLLATKFFGTYIAKDEMLNVALDEFINKHLK